MSSWVAYCSEGHEALVRRALALLDGAGDLMLARSADVLRRIAEGCEPGELGFVVGPIGEGVSAVNLAAAVARCGNARCVVMGLRPGDGVPCAHEPPVPVWTVWWMPPRWSVRRPSGALRWRRRVARSPARGPPSERTAPSVPGADPRPARVRRGARSTLR